MENRGRLRVLACNSGKTFALRVMRALEEIVGNEEGRLGASCFGLTDVTEVVFPNGEVKTVINESLRGDDVYVIQCVDDPLSPQSVNDNLMALLTCVNAAFHCDADRVTAVLPQFPYARQERKKARESITAKQVCRFLEISGASHVITLDIHSEAIAGFFEHASLDNLHATKVLLARFRAIHPRLDNLTVVSPDVGSAERARFLSRRLSCTLAICDKERDYSRPGVIKQSRLVGDVAGRDVLIMDDMIATGGSIIEAAAICKDKGADDVYLGCSLPFFNGEAVERLQAAYERGIFKLVLGTDAVHRGQTFIDDTPWYLEVSVAPLFAQVIYNINRRRSVSALLR